MAKCIVSSSILVALRLILNISVKFLSEETSYCADMGPAHWTTSSISAGRAAFLPRSFDVCIKIVHLVAVKRNSGSTGIEHPRYCRRSLVVLLLLLCSFFFERIDPEWHQEVLFCVLSIRSISVACSPRLCGPWTSFMGWQQWLLHNQGSGNNPPVLKSSFSLEMESFSDGTVCVCVCVYVWTMSPSPTYKQRHWEKSPHLQTLADTVLISEDRLLLCGKYGNQSPPAVINI